MTSGRFKWEKLYDGLVYVMTSDGCEPRNNISAFDLDWTLIGTKSGRVFPSDHKDWRFLYGSLTVEKVRHQYHDKNNKIVVISNQSGLGNRPNGVENFKQKVEAVAQQLKDVPIQVFVSTAKGSSPFRKPRTAIWELLTRDFNGNHEDVSIDVENSFYCGDAAGRTKKSSDGKKDFACSDRLFALNLGLPFKTPEQFFCQKSNEEDYQLPAFDPKSVFRTNLGNFLEPPSATLTSARREVVLMCGIQGSGKSVVAEELLSKGAGYVVLSNDKIGSRDKTLKALKEALSRRSESCVIDNTHVDREARKKFIDAAKEFKTPCRCFEMKTTFAQAKHNNVFREITDKQHTKIGEPLMHNFKAKYQNPCLDEGFDEIVSVNFLPMFRTEEHKEIYSMYLCEK